MLYVNINTMYALEAELNTLHNALNALATALLTPQSQPIKSWHLSRAIDEKKPETVKLLISEGVNVNDFLDPFAAYMTPLDGEFFAPLFKAIKIANLEIVRLLIKAGADVNTHFTGDTPLYAAAKRGAFDIVRELIEAGANPNLVTEFPAYILKHRSDLGSALGESIPNENETPLALAIRENKPRVVQAFVTSASPQDIHHVIPAIIALTMRPSNVGKDIGSIIAAQLIPEIVNEKLALARQYLPNIPEEQLRQEIIASINRVIAKSPRIQAAVQQPIAQ